MSEHENPSPQWALHEHELWLESLPELTDKERAALDSVDMTEVLGTPEKREQVAMDAALRYMRRCREKDAEIERLRGELTTLTGQHLDELSRHGESLREVERLRAALKPFAAVAAGIPDNWPGQCRLRIDGNREYTREWLCYHGVNDCPGATLPTIDEWREAAKAAGGE